MSWAEEFGDLDPPDLERPEEAMIYARRVNLLCLHRVMTAADLSPDDMTRLRLAKDLVAALGMTHSRGMVEDKLAKLTRKREKTALRDGMEISGNVKRPSTARIVEPCQPSEECDNETI